jgi:hypothetical protein
VVRIRGGLGPARDPGIAVDAVRLNPPHSWHLDQIDATDRQAVDYRVRAVRRGRTRVHLLSTERWLTPEFPTCKALRAQIRFSEHLAEKRSNPRLTLRDLLHRIFGATKE